MFSTRTNCFELRKWRDAPITDYHWCKTVGVAGITKLAFVVKSPTVGGLAGRNCTAKLTTCTERTHPTRSGNTRR